MARPWTDEWVRALPHPVAGAPETVFKDPALAGHRLTVTRTRKKFEVQARPPKTRKSYVVIVGEGTSGTTVEAARAKANETLAKIRAGRDPRETDPSAGADTTLGQAWEAFAKRTDLRPGPLKVYTSVYNTHLAKWANWRLLDLKTASQMVIDEHVAITKRSGPSAADHAMRLLRAIYFHAAANSNDLPIDRNPTTGLRLSKKWHGDKKRNIPIPAGEMPQWKKQLDALRDESPQRASYQLLLLRLGCRPGELASAKWQQVDLKTATFWIPVSKTEEYETPIPKQALAEFKKLAALREGEYVFPARGPDGHLKRLQDERLSHSSNQLRHSHHTVGGVLGIDDRTLDVIEGRTLLKAGAAGRGYLNRPEFGPKARAAQQAISDRIDALFKAKPIRRR